MEYYHRSDISESIRTLGRPGERPSDTKRTATERITGRFIVVRRE